MKLEPIDTSTTEGKIEVMRLASEGRQVATRYAYKENSTWSVVDLSDKPLWNWGNHEYAIRAEPVGPEEAWAVVSCGSVVFESDESVAISMSRRHGGTVVRYVRADD